MFLTSLYLMLSFHLITSCLNFFISPLLLLSDCLLLCDSVSLVIVDRTVVKVYSIQACSEKVEELGCDGRKKERKRDNRIWKW